MSTQPTLVVTGAAGQLGRRVVELLLEARAGRIVATTRAPEKLKDLAARGVDVRRADFDDIHSLEHAFAGGDRLLLISTDALGKRRTQHADAVRAAVTAGVGHILYTSIISPAPSPEGGVPDEHFWTEQAIAAAPVGWTFLRNNIYSDVILWSLPQAVKAGRLVNAGGDYGRSYVTREDCARVAAAALGSGFAGKRILDVTGPAPVNGAALAALASELSGKRVDHVGVTPEELKKGLVAGGMPAHYADVTVAFDVMERRGYYAVTTPVVEELTGRQPTSVRDYLTAHRAALTASA